MMLRSKYLPTLLWLALCACAKDGRSPESPHKSVNADVRHDDAFHPSAETVEAAADPPATPVPTRQAVPAQGEHEPPVNGVFELGAANEVLAPGAPPKITLGSDGAEPRLKLGPRQPAGKQAGTVRIALQLDPDAPALAVLLGVTIDSKQVKAKSIDKGAVSQSVSVRITRAKADDPGIPKEVDQRIARLKGHKFEYHLSPNGAATSIHREVTHDALLDDVLVALSDTLGLLNLPFPDQPLGVGAYFLVTSRDELIGIDVLTYWTIKVEAVTADGATVDVTTRRWAASSTYDLPGLPRGVEPTLSRFEATSEGHFNVVSGALLPAEGEMTSATRVQFTAADPSRVPLVLMRTGTRLELK